MKKPRHGETVIEVPQAYHHLVRELDGQLFTHVLATHIKRGEGAVRLMDFDIRHDPRVGYGLLVIEEGKELGVAKVFSGPTNWDSGD